MMAMLSLAIYNIMDTIWLSWINPYAVAAFTITFPLQMTLAAIGIGTGVGAGSLAARMFGAKDEKTHIIAGQTVFLSVTISLLVILIVLFYGRELLTIFGGEGITLELSLKYLNISIIGSPFLLLILTGTNLLRAEGRPELAMFTIIIFTITGAVCDPLFIFGLGPFPQMGIVGSALSAVLGQLTGGLLLLYFLSNPTSRYQMRLQHLRPNLYLIREIYKTGFPSVLMNLLVSGVITVYTNLLSHYGPMALATLGICFRVNGLLVMMLFGIGHGVLPIVGFNYGAKLYKRLVTTIKVAIISSTIFASFTSFIVLILADYIVLIFTQETTLFEMSRIALRLYISSLVFAGPSIVLINMFIGLGKGTTSMWLMFIRDGVLLIPFLYLFQFWMGFWGIWIAQPVAAALAFLIIYKRARMELENFKQIANR
ncbi:MAG: MATE family efflux transporter [Syntrophales bacterium]|nr:MATE family efflux transporter [Syntrophales bacterium]